LARWHPDVCHEAAAARGGRYLDHEDGIQGSAAEVAAQRQVQCAAHLLAQLPGLLFHPSTSISLSMLGFLQGSLEFRIEQVRCNVTFANAL
jgi:hypothetical protein